MKTTSATISALAIAVGLTGCGQGGGTPAPAGAPAETPSALSAVFAAVPAPAELLPIPELRLAAQPGEDVVLEGKIMGTHDPFVENRAVFVVGDEGTLTSCDLEPGSQCATPWDTCCDDPDVIRAGTATIQVVDDAGNVLRHGIKGVSGLKELSRLRIAGTVAPTSTEAALIINAARIEML